MYINKVWIWWKRRNDACGYNIQSKGCYCIGSEYISCYLGKEREQQSSVLLYCMQYISHSNTIGII